VQIRLLTESTHDDLFKSEIRSAAEKYDGYEGTFTIDDLVDEVENLANDTDSLLADSTLNAVKQYRDYQSEQSEWGYRADDDTAIEAFLSAIQHIIFKNELKEEKMKKMRVLVACEYSGAVRDAFKSRGHYAMSVDLLPTDVPGEHYQGDVLDVLDQGWDLLIAHPPCTYLTLSANAWLKDQPPLKSGKLVGAARRAAVQESVDFFMKFVNAPIDKIAIENPIGVMNRIYRKPDQIIQPWMFGHSESKATCLWLKNLPKLTPTKVLQKPERGYWDNQTPSGQNKLAPDKDRWKERSKTYPGIALSFAEQWG
jgi:hypothetical protein